MNGVAFTLKMDGEGKTLINRFLRFFKVYRLMEKAYYDAVSASLRAHICINEYEHTLTTLAQQINDLTIANDILTHRCNNYKKAISVIRKSQDKKKVAGLMVDQLIGWKIMGETCHP